MINIDLMKEKLIFYSRVNEKTGCREWIGGKTSGKYGYVRWPNNGYQERAHRVAYKLYKGDIPEDLVVRHLCHNTVCINPDHLEIGTYADNNRDSMEANRYPLGSNRKNSLLKESDIPIIRKLLNLGVSLNSIGRKFGVSHRPIKNILIGRSWRHVV